jgi:hypothetical protein
MDKPNPTPEDKRIIAETLESGVFPAGVNATPLNLFAGLSERLRELTKP